MARHKGVGQVAIANGASLSSPISLGEKALCGIIVPPAWTAAGLTFQTSDDGGATWQNVFDSTGAEVTIASAGIVAGQRVSVDPKPFAGIDFLKVRSGTGAAPVNQGGARALTIVSRKVYPLTFAGVAAATGTGPTGPVTFLGYDTATQGQWKGVYGQDGGEIFGESGLTFPSYITPSSWSGGVSSFDFGSSSAASSFFLQKPSALNLLDRTGNVYYTTTSMTRDFVVTDGQAHTLALYQFDPDNNAGGRSWHAWISDLSNVSLDDRGIISGTFTAPKYILWRITGSVRLHLDITGVTGGTATGIDNGFFFST